MIGQSEKGASRRPLIALAIACLVLQLAVGPNVALLGGRPNLALVYVACALTSHDSSHAPAYGFFAGLIFDLTGSGPIGLMALLLTVCAFLIPLAGRVGAGDAPLVGIVGFAALAFVVEVAYGVILMALGLGGSLFDTILMRALPGAVLDCVFFAVVVVVLARLTQGPAAAAGHHARLGRKGGRYSTRGL